MKRLGLFGGTFDPVHRGHLLVAQAATEEFKLDTIVFIPAAQSPFKPELQPTAPDLRMQLLRLALAGHSHYQLDAQEVERGGVSYTIDTVRRYREAFPKATLYYLIGSDHVPQLSKWRSAAELAAATEFLVIPRPGQTPLSLPEPFRGETLRGFPLGISSSQIRARVRENLPIDDLVPAAVSEAIRNHHLYL